MNLYKPFESTTGGWHFCCQNDNLIYPVGYCREHSPHTTEQEARECYTKYLLDNRLQLVLEDKHEQRKCQVCGEWTNLFALLNHIEIFWLCQEHNNREEIKKLSRLVGDIYSSF